MLPYMMQNHYWGVEAPEHIYETKISFFTLQHLLVSKLHRSAKLSIFWRSSSQAWMCLSCTATMSLSSLSRSLSSAIKSWSSCLCLLMMLFLRSGLNACKRWDMECISTQGSDNFSHNKLEGFIFSWAMFIIQIETILRGSFCSWYHLRPSSEALRRTRRDQVRSMTQTLSSTASPSCPNRADCWRRSRVLPGAKQNAPVMNS